MGDVHELRRVVTFTWWDDAVEFARHYASATGVKRRVVSRLHPSGVQTWEVRPAGPAS